MQKISPVREILRLLPSPYELHYGEKLLMSIKLFLLFQNKPENEKRCKRGL